MSYGRHISGLWLCETADFATNDLPTAPTETFTATKQIKQARAYAPGTPVINYLLNTWTSIKRVEVGNLSESIGDLYFSFTTPDDPTYTSYVILGPGQSAVLANLHPASTLWSGADAASIQVDANGFGAYYRLIVLGT